jgi:hypothetical protein
MSADTRTSRRISAPIAVLFAANAVAQFAIQAVLAYGFGAKVWGLKKLWEWLPLAVPVALDIFAITLMVFAYQLRGADLRQRVYVWVWLGVAIACQVGAAEGFADHEDWGMWGRGASLFPSIFLAASLHALIIASRKRDHVGPGGTLPGWLTRRRTARRVARGIKAERRAARRTVRVVTITPRVLAADAGQPREAPSPPPPKPPAPPPTGEPDPVPTPRRPLPSARRGANGHKVDGRKAAAVRRVIEGSEPASAVARDIGESPRNVQNWVAAARRTHGDVTGRERAGAGARP